MLSALLDPVTQKPRTPLFWAVFAGLIFAQLLLLWALCSHQVRLAEARDAETVMQRMALNDCLQYVPGATIATCTSRMAQNGPPNTATMGAGPAPAAGVVPASFQR